MRRDWEPSRLVDGEPEGEAHPALTAAGGEGVGRAVAVSTDLDAPQPPVTLHLRSASLPGTLGPSQAQVSTLAQARDGEVVILTDEEVTILDGLEKFIDPTGTALQAAVPNLPQLKEAVAVSIVSGLRRGDELLNASVYVGPHGVQVLRGTEHDEDGTPVTYTLQEVGSQRLRALPGELVAA